MPHVYLLHFDKPLAHAQHYCGYTPNGVDARVKLHRTKLGAHLTKAAVESGCELQIAQVWEHGSWQEARRQERQMKKTHNLPRYCPLCGGRVWTADEAKGVAL